MEKITKRFSNITGYKGLLKRLFADIMLGAGLMLLVAGILLVSRARGGREFPTEETHVAADRFSLEYKRPVGEQTVVIPEGSNTLEVAAILEDEGIVDGERFLEFIEYLDIEKSIRAGDFNFSTEDELDDVLQKIMIRR